MSKVHFGWRNWSDTWCGLRRVPWGRRTNSRFDVTCFSCLRVMFGTKRAREIVLARSARPIHIHLVPDAQRDVTACGVERKALPPGDSVVWTDMRESTTCAKCLTRRAEAETFASAEAFGAALEAQS